MPIVMILHCDYIITWLSLCKFGNFVLCGHSNMKLFFFWGTKGLFLNYQAKPFSIFLMKWSDFCMLYSLPSLKKRGLALLDLVIWNHFSHLIPMKTKEFRTEMTLIRWVSLSHSSNLQVVNFGWNFKEKYMIGKS